MRDGGETMRGQFGQFGQAIGLGLGALGLDLHPGAWESSGGRWHLGRIGEVEKWRVRGRNHERRWCDRARAVWAG